MADKQGRFVILDTTLNKTDATLIDELSGRQGDNGRIVYFALKDGQFPHDLTGQDVQLEVKDSAGKVKVIHGINERMSDKGGLFNLIIPAEVYQASGDVQEAYLAVVDDNGVKITSVPIAFTVFENGIIISANASQDYLSSVDKMIADVEKKIDDLAAYYDALNGNEIPDILVSLTISPTKQVAFEKVSEVDDIEEYDYVNQTGGVNIG